MAMRFAEDESAKAASSAARSLFDCVQRMGEQASNAVLEVLGDSREMVQERRYPRSPLLFADGRWRAYTYDEIINRDKASLDIFWLRDESLEDSANLPDPHILAGEIAEDLESALEQIQDILGDLEERVGAT